MVLRSQDADAEATLAGDGERPESAPAPAPAPGSAIGRYILLSQVGTGAMGLVFAAYDPQLDRKVALKLLKPRRRDLTVSRERLQREAQALAKLGHPNVVVVYDVGVHADQLFVAMEYVEGQTLAEWIASEPETSTRSRARVETADGIEQALRPWREVLDVFIRAGRGLAAAHEAGLVHRDFKPDNVMLSDDGRVRVMDFGLARVERGSFSRDSDPDTEVGSITQTGALLGTPAYMSVEQFQGGQIDARSDQFGFCVALYEALYGERPFEGDNVGALVAAVTEGSVRGPTRGSNVPGWLRSVLLRGLAPRPEQRYDSMQTLLDALAADPAARRRRIAVWLGVGAAVVTGAWGIVALSGEVEQRDAVIEEQASALDLKEDALRRQLSRQRGLRAASLVGTRNEAEALLLGVQAVGEYAGRWDRVPPEAIEGLEQVLAHDPILVEATEVLAGHEHYLTSVVYSPDGTQLATTSLDGSARIWDPVAAQLRTTLDGHEGPVVSAEFSSDGSRLATASLDGHARVFDVDSGELLSTLDGRGGLLHTVRFVPSHGVLATAGRGRHVHLYDLQTWDERARLATNDEYDVQGLAFTPDADRVAVACTDGKTRVWDVAHARLQSVLDAHEGPVNAVAVSPDGTRLATAGDDQRARLWALDSGESLATFEGHDARVTAVAFSPDGRRLVTVSWDTTGRLYDAATADLVATLDGGHGQGIPVVAYAPDSSRIATGSYDGNVAVWDGTTGELEARLRGHRADVWGLTFSPDARRVATGSVDHSVRLWDLREARVAALEGPESDVRDFDYSPDHTRLATIAADGRVRLWKAERGELLHTLEEAEGGARKHLAFAPDGVDLAVMGAGRLRIWDTANARLRATADVGGPTFASVIGYAASGEHLRLTDNQHVWTFDARTLQPLATLEVDEPFAARALAPNDARVAYATSEPGVQIWDAQTDAMLVQLPTKQSVTAIALSPSGEAIATLDSDAHVGVWDAKTGQRRVELTVPSDFVGLRYSPDGVHLAGGSGSEGVQIWDARTGELVMHIEPQAQETGRHSIVYSPDGSRFAVFGAEFMRIHDRATGDELAYVDGVLIRRPVFWPDGKRLTNLRRDRTLEVFDTTSGEMLTRERIGLVKADGSIDWPIPPRALTRIGCERLQMFARAYPDAAQICDPLLAK